jgi:dienelactone hydrolase
MVTTRDITYEADGRTMVGTVALPDGTDRRPGVLVSHEGPGLDDFGRSRAIRLAEELGYVAFALDYQGDGRPLQDREQMMARLGELSADPLRTRAIGGAVHSFTNPRAALVDIPGIAYHEPTDRRSWQAMLDLFAEVFG